LVVDPAQNRTIAATNFPTALQPGIVSCSSVGGDASVNEADMLVVLSK